MRNKLRDVRWVVVCASAFTLGLILGTIQIPIVIVAKLIKNPLKVGL